MRKEMPRHEEVPPLRRYVYGRTRPQLARCGALGIVVLLLASVLGGCDGEGTVEVIAPPGQQPGPRVTGQVRLPNGELARAATNWERIVTVLSQPVQALFAPSVEPVGSGVTVELVFVDPAEANDGELPGDLEVLATAQTNTNGQYQVNLPANTNADRCRYMVQVGDAADGTLTRAFVYRSNGPVDINFISETVVRQILAALGAGAAEDLCDFESADIGALYEAILAAPGTIAGNSIAAVNAASNAAVTADPALQDLIDDASLPGPLPATPTPTATVEGAATATLTATIVLTRTPTTSQGPTATETVRPTRTEGATPSTTPSRSRTGTAPPTTPTATNTVAPTATSTGPPTATGTSVVVPTNTVPPPTVTHTSSVVTPTVPPPTNTPQLPTATVTRTPSQVSGAALNVGVASGSAGMIVSVPGALVGTGIAAVSTDIEFDTALVDVVLNNGDPDCEGAPSLPGNKRVVASLPSVAGLPAGHRVLRVGVIGTNNNDPLPMATLFNCLFAINGNAPLGNIPLLNAPDASDALGNAVAIMGTDGTITVTTAPPSLDLNMVVGTAGEAVTISATLHNRGQVFSALATDIAVGTAMLDVVLGGDQTPDCIVDAAIGPGTALNKEIFAALVPAGSGAGADGDASGASTEVLRVGLIARNNNTPIPDGVVFHCDLAVPGGTASQIITLTHTPEGSTPDGMIAGLQGGPGEITVVQP
jgi:hypothetical protein